MVFFWEIMLIREGDKISGFKQPSAAPVSLSFLKVDVSAGSQAFSHDTCNIFPGLSYKTVIMIRF